MAITERYVTQAAPGGGDGSSSNPWTFAEAITHSLSNTGQRYNIQSDAAYSIGATTFGACTFDAPNIWRGYNSTIGDCDNLGRNADGTLNTTGMPEITLTGSWIVTAYNVLQNLNITTSLNTTPIGDGTNDHWHMISCRVENTGSAGSGACVRGDNEHVFTNCDFVLSGSAHSYAYNGDSSITFYGCRFEITANADCLQANSNCQVLNCVFLKRGSLGGTAINGDTAITANVFIIGCTFYNLEYAYISISTHTVAGIWFIRNHITDCTQWISNTTNIACYDIQNRIRDNTSPPATVELITVGAITTDTGGASTDYNNTATGDLHLITTAAGYNAGWDGSDIGGLQTDPPAGGGGGSALHLGQLGQTGIGHF
jgi:hypothetical protein